MSTTRTVLIVASAMLVAPAAQADPADLAGFYVGAHLGYHVDAKADFEDGGVIDDEGTMGGFQLGYNVLSGNVIWGLETDISLTDANPSGTCPFDAALNCDVDIDGMATLRARLGYASGDWLIYATGGAAGAQLDIETSGAAGSSRDNEGGLGWTAGAGIEYMVGSGIGGVNNTVGVKLEYRYVDLFHGMDIDATPTTGSDEYMDLETHTVMIGINWHF